MIMNDPHIRVGIQALLLDPECDPAEPRILMGLRSGVFGDGTWGLPGGHLEFGESFDEGMARELDEELGIIARDMTVLGVYNTVTEFSHHVQIGILVERFDRTPRNREPHRCRGIAYFDLGDLPSPVFVSSAPILEAFRSEYPPLEAVGAVSLDKGITALNRSRR
jgi:8-oxo-dGTP diphosphatase